MIPNALKTETRWVAWRLVHEKKPPVGDDGRPMSAWQEPTSWLTYDDAAARADGFDGQAGVGFVLGDGWAGLDLDDCREPKDGTLDPRAEAILDVSKGAYSEVSPSGKGIKVFGRGTGWLELTFRKDAVEVTRKATGYFTVTGEECRGGDAVEDLPLDKVWKHFHDGAGRDASSTSASKKTPAAPLPEIIRPGAQNQELFREACRHARAGKSEVEVFAIVKAVAEARCPPATGAAPWTDQDFRAIARSASRYAPSADPYPTTESGDAELFAKQHADSVRYDYRRKRWLRFDGVRWKPQEAGEVERLALETIRARYAAARASQQDDPDNWQARAKWANAGESASRRAHLLDLARREPPIADNGADWDVDGWLLGVKNGVVDLKTGELRAGRPEDRITMQAATSFDPSAECPLWEATIADVLKDNPDLVPYLHRALGYSITGNCGEEVFFLLTGEGRNGKGTLINTVSTILGDYSDNLAFSSLEHSPSGDKDKPSNDLAKLVGKRIVTASETSGGRLNEARLKSMTGRDEITARFLFAEHFTFVPTFKLWLSVNHLPKVHDDSTGFWSRPHRVPFLQCYEGRENKTLKDDLLGEAEGILAWLVRGVLAWRQESLAAPEVVRGAVKEYRQSQTPLAAFYADEIVFHEDARIAASVLREAYVRWCDERRVFGDRRLGPQQFARELATRVGKAAKTRHGATYAGLGLAAGEDDATL